jgi:hypothetical protein
MMENVFFLVAANNFPVLDFGCTVCTEDGGLTDLGPEPDLSDDFVTHLRSG